MEKQRCNERVHERDTYRYTGRGEGGFEMHYRARRCKRRARKSGYCWQHERVDDRRAG